jgi:hypothetical protein
MIRKYLLALIFATALPSHAQIAGYHYRFDDWQSRAIFWLAQSAPQEGVLLSQQPYNRLVGARFLVRNLHALGIAGYYSHPLLAEYSRLPRKRTPWYAELMWRTRPDYSNELHPEEEFALESDLVGYMNWSPNLSAYFDFQVDTDGLYDSDYHGTREWKELAGDMRAAYFLYQQKKWSLLVGRDVIHWGPGRTGALLTSGFAPALDMIKLKARFWKLQFTAFDALLGKDDRLFASNVNRYFCGHRLTFRSGRVELGLSETIMFGGPDEVISPGYLNPLISYYLMDVMGVEGQKDNVTLAMDASYYGPSGWRLYGQFAVDEYYYEGEEYPNRTALLLGASWIQPFQLQDLIVNAEYVRIDRWMYNYEIEEPWNRLVYYNSLLGHPIGPDADLLHLEAEIALTRSLLLRPQIQLQRNGETSVFTPLSTPQELGKDDPPFPYGVIETQFRPSLVLEYFPDPAWRFYLYLQYQNTSNVNHIELDSEGRFAIKAGLESWLSARWF